MPWWWLAGGMFLLAGAAVLVLTQVSGWVVALAFSGLLVLAFAGMFAGMGKSFTASIDRSGADIMVLASHNMDVVRGWCTRAIRLEAGRIVADGPVGEVLDGMARAPAEVGG